MMNGNIPSFLLDAVSDDGIPDFYVRMTFEQWWENASQSNSFWLFLGIIIGFISGIIISFFWWYINKKANEEEKRENNLQNNENKTE